jgi:hypothetical protein
MIHPDKYHLRQYLVDEPDPELRRIFHLIRHHNPPWRNPESMDPKSIVFYLVATLGEGAITYSTVTKYLRGAQISLSDPTPRSDATSRLIDEPDKTILGAVEGLPFSSVSQFSCATHTHTKNQGIQEILREARVYGASSPMRATDPIW